MWTRHRAHRPPPLERRGWGEEGLVGRPCAAGGRPAPPWPPRGRGGTPPPRGSAADLLWRPGAADGVVIAAASSADRARLPAVSDASGAALALSRAQPGARLPATLVELATQLLDGLPRLVGPDVALRYDLDTGLVADTGHGLAIVFGDPSRPPNDMPAGAAGQLAELQILLQTLDQRQERASWIDLRWGTHPAYRLA